MTDSTPPQEEMRYCPTCRSLISVWAVKCRYCGEEVGRPKKEEAHFTVKDLGGDSTSTYVVSGDVIEAIEAFREEERARREAEEQEKLNQSTWFRRKTSTEAPADASQAPVPPTPKKKALNELLKELDEPNTRTQHKRRDVFEGISRNVLIFAGVVAGIVLLYVTMDYTWGIVKDYFYRPQTTAGYENRALMMLDQGQPVTAALQEALAALGHDPSPENRAIADQVRLRVIEHVQNLLTAHPWSLDKLHEASRVASQAAQLDGDPRIKDLFRQVEAEVAAYKMVVVEISPDQKTAKFRLQDPSFPQSEQVVQVGDFVANRFLVTAITATSVRLEDTRIKSPTGDARRLVCRVLAPVASAL
jgi:ribosomal protein L40E